MLGRALKILMAITIGIGTNDNRKGACKGSFFIAEMVDFIARKC